MTSRTSVESTRIMASAPAVLPEVTDAPDEATLARAQQFLEELASGLFPDGELSTELLTWADRTFNKLDDTIDRRSIEERLKAAEARFMTLVEQIPAVTFMAVLGDGENDVYVSPHVQQMLGYSQEQWLSDPFLWYTRLHPDDRVLWNEEFTRGCRTGGPFRAECRFLARDGRVVWVHGEARLVRDELGRPQFLQGVAFDITESKRAQSVLLERAVSDARIQEELEIARRVQTAILPVAPALRGLELAASMLPAEDVGGDYYDALPSADGGWLAIGDVSGHGLNAGLVMLMLQSAVASITLARDRIAPSELLSLVNETLYNNVALRLRRDEYVTLTLLRYSSLGHVSFAGAHQDILVCRHRTGRVERIKTPGPWVGVREHIRSVALDSSFELRDQDVMVLFTDGVIEAMNEAGEQFDVPRLCAAIEATQRKSVEEIRDAVVVEVQRWMARQEDDITLVVARYHATPKP